MRRRRKTGHADTGGTCGEGVPFCRGQCHPDSGEGTGAAPGSDVGDFVRIGTSFGECGTGQLGDKCRMAVAGLMQVLDARHSRAHNGSRGPVGTRFECQNHKIVLSVRHPVRLPVLQIQPEHQLALARPCLAQYDRAIIHL